jgi:hypothetical protein
MSTGIRVPYTYLFILVTYPVKPYMYENTSSAQLYPLLTGTQRESYDTWRRLPSTMDLTADMGRTRWRYPLRRITSSRHVLTLHGAPAWRPTPVEIVLSYPKI